METLALIAARRTPRALYAAVLLAVLLAALLGAWFVSGWHDVRMRQREARVAPRAAADERAADLARELRAELDALLIREVRRPYFHYQNLMHDPRASAAVSVSPSPLATKPDDRFVLGYFQIDSKGRATTPTINDDVPELSDNANLAANRAFRDQVVRDLARELTPKGGGALVAEVTAPKALPKVKPVAHAQVYQIDPQVYAQNVSSNAVYVATNAPPKPRPPRVVESLLPPPAAPITITVSALEWQPFSFAGKPALVAVREVQTPDGAFTQGFVIDPATLTSWLATKAGDMVAELHAGGTDRASGAHDVAPGWQLTVAPNPRTVARAASSAGAVAKQFLTRFIAIGAVALLVAAFIFLLVLRAEQLARERSQFAAAAAHELRTPLAGLQLYGDMLADGLGDPSKVRDYARRMSEEASRLGRVVSNVLGFSQLERGNLSVNAQVDALGEALRELAERAEPALDRAGAALELDVSPDVRARFDRDALARIVGNLLDNAEKYSRAADDRTIRLAVRDKGDVVEVEVADHGPGVADAGALFRAFSRGVTNDGPAGLGLGLALSQSLAQAMGGDLRYAHADGAGATFILRLPRA